MFGLTPDPESFPSQAPLEEFTKPGYDQWGKPLSGQEAADARYQALVGGESDGSPLAGTELDTSRKKEGGGKLSTLLKWGLPAAGIALALGGFGVPGFKFLQPAAGGIGKFLFGTGGGGGDAASSNLGLGFGAKKAANSAFRGLFSAPPGSPFGYIPQ